MILDCSEQRRDVPLVRLLTILVIAAGGLAIPASGLGGSSSGHVYSARDVASIVDAKPVLPGWSFTEADPYFDNPPPAHPPAFTLRDWANQSDADAATAKKLATAGFLLGRHHVRDGHGKHYAQAVVYAFLFRDASGASAGFRALNSGHDPGDRALPANGLGEEASGVHNAGGCCGQEIASYFWRTGNLLIAAEMVCDRHCDFPVVQPARAYAGQLASRAKRRA